MMQQSQNSEQTHLPVELLLGHLPSIHPVFRLKFARDLRRALLLPRRLLHHCLRCCSLCIPHPVHLVGVQALLLQRLKLALLLLLLLLPQLPASCARGQQLLMPML